MANSKIFHIIGAGISGLTLAYELLKKGKNVRVYESLQTPGGLTRTESIKGVNFDCGPHLFHTNNKEIKKYWQDLLGDSILTPQLYGANYQDGKVYEYPISIESLNEQFTKEEIKTIKSELKKLKNKNLNNSKSYQEYVQSLAGNYLVKKFFTNYPKKLWGIPTSKLSAKFAPRRIEIRSKKRPFHSGKGKWAGVLRDGCGSLSKKLEERINLLGTYIEYNKEVTNIVTNSKQNGLGNYVSIDKLKFKNKKNISLNKDDIVISTMPITELGNLLKIKHNLWNRSLKIVNVLVKGRVSLPNNYDWLYFDDKKYIFHRITLQNSFSQTGIPSKHSIISCEIAYSKNDKISKMPKSKCINQCIKDLKDIDSFKDMEVITSHLIDAKDVYPGIFVGYEEELSRLKGRLSFYDNLYTHGALAEYEYSDTQVLTAKAIDLAQVLTSNELRGDKSLTKQSIYKPAAQFSINNRMIGKDQKV